MLNLNWYEFWNHFNCDTVYIKDWLIGQNRFIHDNQSWNNIKYLGTNETFFFETGSMRTGCETLGTTDLFLRFVVFSSISRSPTARRKRSLFSKILDWRTSFRTRLADLYILCVRSGCSTNVGSTICSPSSSAERLWRLKSMSGVPFVSLLRIIGITCRTEHTNTSELYTYYLCQGHHSPDRQNPRLAYEIADNISNRCTFINTKPVLVVFLFSATD